MLRVAGDAGFACPQAAVYMSSNKAVEVSSFFMGRNIVARWALVACASQRTRRAQRKFPIADC